jgi:catechol 2,3-dioxygenase-like lactoylglutathione lyase family enzyme
MMDPVQVRIARPTRDLERVSAFYRDAVGLQMVAAFDEHDGYSGVVFGIPDASRQLELVFHAEVDPAPTSEDQLVLYLGSAAAVEERAAAIRAAGHESQLPANRYWARQGSIAFVDPDGYWLILSPDRWG